MFDPSLSSMRDPADIKRVTLPPRGGKGCEVCRHAAATSGAGGSPSQMRPLSF